MLVTGATGFLGSAACAAARDAGAEVHALIRRGSDAGDSPRLQAVARFWQADLAVPAEVERVLSELRPDAVLHAAGHSSAERTIRAVGPTLRDNLVATASLLTACHEAGVARVVLCGSTEAPSGAVEDVVPSSPYAASKLAESFYGRMFHRLYGLGVVEARLSVTYGPGRERPGKLIPHLIGRLLSGRPAELSSGRRRIDWLYVDDAAAGLVACLAAPGIDGRTIELGTGTLTSVQTVATRIADLVGRPDLLRLGVLPDRTNEVERRIDPAVARQLLGWQAQVGVDDGLARTVEHYRRVFPPATADGELVGR
ncbi:MAG TPA: NAD-dependent epimerase/dehydratase family protein [Humisphaera sp.]